MPALPYPKFEELRTALRTLVSAARPREGVFYRCVEARFAHDFVSGHGSRLHGGRWNPKGSFRAVYLSDSPEAALQEYLARARRMRWPDSESMPMMMAAVTIKVSSVLDLTEPESSRLLEPFLKSEPVHWRTIQDRRETVSQAVGRAARAVCFQGLLARSQQVDGGQNLVLFPDKLGRGDRIAAPRLRIAELK